MMALGTGAALLQRAVLVVVLLGGTVACVSHGKYEAALGEREKLAAEKKELEKNQAELQARLSKLDTDAKTLEEKLAKREREVAQLRGTYDDLVSDLEDEIATGKVEIEQLKNGIRLNVANEILFPSGSARVDTKGQEVLGKVSARLVGTRNQVEVLGHTDDVPISEALSKRYPTNWELAGGRAASVVRLIESQGVESTRLRAVSLSKNMPVAPNASEEGRAKNRRIEIRLLPADASDMARSDDAAREIPAAPDVEQTTSE